MSEWDDVESRSEAEAQDLRLMLFELDLPDRAAPADRWAKELLEKLIHREQTRHHSVEGSGAATHFRPRRGMLTTGPSDEFANQQITILVALHNKYGWLLPESIVELIAFQLKVRVPIDLRHLPYDGDRYIKGMEVDFLCPGLTDPKLAARVGVDRKTIGKWRRGPHWQIGLHLWRTGKVRAPSKTE